jgi:hypothetical protein
MGAGDQLWRLLLWLEVICRFALTWLFDPAMRRWVRREWAAGDLRGLLLANHPHWMLMSRDHWPWGYTGTRSSIPPGGYFGCGERFPTKEQATTGLRRLLQDELEVDGWSINVRRRSASDEVV